MNTLFAYDGYKYTLSSKIPRKEFSSEAFECFFNKFSYLFLQILKIYSWDFLIEVLMITYDDKVRQGHHKLQGVCMMNSLKWESL